MDSLLSHLARISSYRDHHQLDVAVLTALTDLLGTPTARIFDIYRSKNKVLLRLRLTCKDGEFTSPSQQFADPDHGAEPLAKFPALLSAIEQRYAVGHDVAPDGSSVLWLPIWYDDGADSCIALNSAQPYDSAAMELIRGVLDIYTNFQSLLDYSQRDSLTGLLNRKTFDENFSRMVSEPPIQKVEEERPQSDRRHTPQSREHWLAVVDIDHFKSVNDEFGHLYGDEVLILIANLLRASFRSHDRVYRFGGEEFVILLRSVTLDEARRIFERFRSNVEKHYFPQVGRVTVSLGFSSIVNDTPVVILGHVDQALYYAKAHGRNQVCYYDGLVESGLLKSQFANESVEFFFDSQPAP
jgi:diguanylate cyclase (GGDEF)-like protein